MNAHTPPRDAVHRQSDRWAKTFVAIVAGVTAVLLFLFGVAQSGPEGLTVLIWGLFLSQVAMGISLVATTIALFRGEDHPALLVAALLLCAGPIGIVFKLTVPDVRGTAVAALPSRRLQEGTKMPNPENESLPPRGTSREQRPPEQQPRSPQVREPADDDLQEGHLGNTQTANAPTGSGNGARTRADSPLDEQPGPRSGMGQT